MSELKYKVGDKVLIRSIDWYNFKKDETGNIFFSNTYFTPGHQIFCGKEMTIEKIDGYCYRMKEDNGKFCWSDEMITKNNNYKVGDKVLIKSNDWYETNKDEDDYIGDFCPQMSVYCGNVMTISKKVGEYYEMKEDVGDEDAKYLFTDDMIEKLVLDNTVKPVDTNILFKEGDKVICYDGCPGIVESVYVKENGVSYGVSFGNVDFGVYRNTELKPYVPKTPTPEYKDIYKELRLDPSDDDKLATEVTGKDYKLTPPDGYLIGKVTHVNNGIIVEYVKKKPNFPTTYKECCEILNIPELELVYNTDYSTLNLSTYEWKKLNAYNALHKLRVCRDAYWKIAGEQMRLGKSWEPDFTNFEEDRYGLYTSENKIVLDSYGGGDVNVILTFPTEEMRDFFYENFLLTIEQAKELL